MPIIIVANFPISFLRRLTLHFRFFFTNESQRTAVDQEKSHVINQPRTHPTKYQGPHPRHSLVNASGRSSSFSFTLIIIFVFDSLGIRQPYSALNARWEYGFKCWRRYRFNRGLKSRAEINLDASLVIIAITRSVVNNEISLIKYHQCVSRDFSVKYALNCYPVHSQPMQSPTIALKNDCVN